MEKKKKVILDNCKTIKTNGVFIVFAKLYTSLRVVVKKTTNELTTLKKY